MHCHNSSSPKASWLAESSQDRWWFSQCPEEIKHLPESGMFVRYAHGYLMGATADAEDDDNADGTEMDPDFADALLQTFALKCRLRSVVCLSHVARKLCHKLMSVNSNAT